MKSARLVGLVAITSAVFLAGCGGDGGAGEVEGPSLTVTHAQGETEVPEDPEKVVVFDTAVLDTISELGAGDKVAGVPKDWVPEFLSDYSGDDVENAGTLVEPDYEAVNSIQPDLIIIGGRSAEAYDHLSELAPTIDLSVDPSDFLGSFRERTQTLAEIFGEEEAAEQALADIDTKVEQAKGQVKGAGTGLIVLTTGGEVSVYGPGSRFGNVIHDLLGVEAADDDIEAESHGEAVSFEYIAETDPDWLFVVDRDAATGEGGDSAEQVLDNELVAQTTAWQKDQVVYLDPIRWYIVGSGLSTVGFMVDQIGEGVR